MLRQAAAAAVLLAAGLASATPAHADTGRGGGVCDNSGLLVTVCAHETTTPGTGGAKPAHATTGGKKTAEAPCTYTRADPQPPAANLAWEDHTPKDGALYQVECPDTGRAGIVFVPNGTAGPAAPAIDPESVARQAVASMRLEGPAVASPRASGRYPVGAPMWMWVRRTPTAYGPQTATATAGGVTVSATAQVHSIRWDMGDGNTITCLGPGTPYDKQLGKTISPGCGHRYQHSSTDRPGKRYKGHATATWAVTWTAPALGDSGQFTEIRHADWTVRVVEVQVLN
ncbi:ATP/GTP-binding protein [Streptomyces sp. col6]|uniref:ATP/GTP-binding protein n=1 Tax=Streptomyces sp. col6 TaxID=2478958 RepID=UPI0011CEA830|nr:ATP/GTP-binding protein [Streptomyces sp. col6]TXR91756.1 ATP/GTP-binding protein [Streptomyces sp. col6]